MLDIQKMVRENKEKLTGSLTREEIFQSEEFLKELVNWANAVIGREAIKVHLCSGPIPVNGCDTACMCETDIYINTKNPFSEMYTSIEQAYKAILGLMFHELAHKKFHNFDSSMNAVKGLLKNGRFPISLLALKALPKEYEENLNEMESLARSFPSLKMYYAKLYSVVENCVMDPHDEACIMAESGDLVSDCIAITANAHYAGIKPMEQRDPKAIEGNFISILIQLARFGKVYCIDEDEMSKTEAYKAAIKLKPLVDKAVVYKTGEELAQGVSTILAGAWDYLKDAVFRRLLSQMLPPSPGGQSSEPSDDGQKSEKGGTEGGGCGKQPQIPDPFDLTPQPHQKNQNSSESDDDEDSSESSSGQGRSGDKEGKSASSDEDGDSEKEDASSENGDGTEKENDSKEDEDAESGKKSSEEEDGSSENSQGSSSKEDADDSEEGQNSSAGKDGEDGEEEKAQSIEDLLNGLTDEELEQLLKSLEEEIEDAEETSGMSQTPKGSGKGENGDPSAAKERASAKENGVKSDLENLMDKLLQKKAEDKAEAEVARCTQRLLNIADQTSPHKGKSIRFNNSVVPNEGASQSLKEAEKRLFISAVAGRTAKQLLQIVKDQTSGDTIRRLPYGKNFDYKDAYRPDRKCFSKRYVGEDEPDIAFYILCDNSGSMSWGRNGLTRIGVASAAAYLMIKVAAALDIPIEVASHYSCGNGTAYNIYKNYEGVRNDPLAVFNMKPCSCNRDGMAINIAVDRLLKRPEEDKVLIIISDGQPNDMDYGGESAKRDIQEIVRNAKKKGIEVIAAAIGEDKPQIQEIYGSDSFLDVSDMTSLPKRFSKIIERKICG